METKVYIQYRDGSREDITEIFSSYINVGYDVRVSYHSSIVNGNIISDRHQRLHKYANVVIERG